MTTRITQPWARLVPWLTGSTLLLAGCGGSVSLSGERGLPREVPGGDAQRGQQAIERYGCGACHAIPGVPGARGAVGPPLGDLADRSIIGGRLSNTPDNLSHWIQDPQSVDPGNAMPNLGVTAADARDIAAYLYSLR
jgi:cytochrome c